MNSNEISHKGVNRHTEIAKSIIKSSDYGRRISALAENSKVQQKIIEESRKALYHRNGTSFEDLIFIHAVTGEMRKNTVYDKEREVMPTKSMRRMVEKAEDYTIIAIHNHPSSTVPSLADIISMIAHKYKYGLVLGHDGNVFKYSLIGMFNPILYDVATMRVDKNGYTEESLKFFLAEATLAGIMVEVL